MTIKKGLPRLVPSNIEGAQSRGFTLIEMMVVVLIIGLLATVVIVNINNSRLNARDAKRIQDLDSINTAIQMYAEANGKYPDPCDSPSGKFPGWTFCADIDDSKIWIKGLMTDYIPALPHDPTGKDPYYYYYWFEVDDGVNNYKLIAIMESPNGLTRAKNDGGKSEIGYEIFTPGAKNW